MPSAAHSRATACSLGVPSCAGVVRDTSVTPRWRQAAFVAVQALLKEQTELHLNMIGVQELGLPRPRDEAEAREAAGRRVAEAATKLSGARDGERAGLGPS